MITEVDEQAVSKEEALQNVGRVFGLYLADKETGGILWAYQATALHLGATWAEIEVVMQKCRVAHHKEAQP